MSDAREAAVEKVARAIKEAHESKMDADYLGEARAAIAAYLAALAEEGKVVVPREPTEAMLEAHRCAYHAKGVIAVNQWKAALAAAPKEES